MTPDIEAAAERLEANDYRYEDCVTRWNFSYQREADVCALADAYLAALPELRRLREVAKAARDYLEYEKRWDAKEFGSLVAFTNAAKELEAALGLLAIDGRGTT